MKYSGQMPTVQKDIGVLNGLMLAIEREVKLILVSGQLGICLEVPFEKPLGWDFLPKYSKEVLQAVSSLGFILKCL